MGALDKRSLEYMPCFYRNVIDLEPIEDIEGKLATCLRRLEDIRREIKQGGKLAVAALRLQSIVNTLTKKLANRMWMKGSRSWLDVELELTTLLNRICLVTILQNLLCIPHSIPWRPSSTPDRSNDHAS